MSFVSMAVFLTLAFELGYFCLLPSAAAGRPYKATQQQAKRKSAPLLPLYPGGTAVISKGRHKLRCLLPSAAAGCWVLGAGCWLLGAGCWVLGAGCRVLAAGCWVLAGLYIALPASSSMRHSPCSLLPAPCSLLPAPCSLLPGCLLPFARCAKARVAVVTSKGDAK